MEWELWQALPVVAVGSALGGLLRYGVASTVDAWCNRPWPWGTLAVNLTGAFLLGILAGDPSLQEPAGWLWLLGAVGLLGSYTTVSALSLQSWELARTGRSSAALLYLAVSVGVGLPLAAIGHALRGWV